MKDDIFDRLTAAASDVSLKGAVGQVIDVGRGAIRVSGLGAHSSIGDMVSTRSTDGRELFGEVVALSGGQADVLLDGSSEGFRVGQLVRQAKGAIASPAEDWIGRVVDPYGQSLDGRDILPGPKSQKSFQETHATEEKRGLGQRLSSNLAAFNTVLPLVRGQRVGLFAGSGVGKTSLLGKLARSVEADVTVLALIGERGREVREFVHDVLGPDAMSKTVVVASTSDRAPHVRRRCAMTAMAVAEYFRDCGKQVLLLADSLTRFAEAHREVAVFAGESSDMRGFPPSTSAMLSHLCERAGPGAGQQGDITAVFTVLVAGSDMDEPISDIVRGLLDGHIILDRTIAERGRFPAIDLLRSVSRSLPRAATKSENELLAEVRQLLGAFDRSRLMIQSGLYVSGTDAVLDRAIACEPALDAFLALDEEASIASSFTKLRGCLAVQTGQSGFEPVNSVG